MKNEEAVMSSQRPRSIGVVLTPEERGKIVRRFIGTVLGTLVFAVALVVSGSTHLGMPGHIVVFWFPALMAGRALGGYRGSGIVVSMAGGTLVNAYHPPADSSLFGFVLAAFVVEGILLLARQNPAAWLGILMGMAASLGKIAPKVAAVLIGGGMPHHNRATLPFMLVSYLMFGLLAGVIYAGGSYMGRKARSRTSSSRPL